MREIKFRAWNQKLLIMMDFDEIFANYQHNRAVSLKEILGDSYYDFMQYTGLKDKNNKEIYEGDIVKSIVRDNYVKNMDGVKEDINFVKFRGDELRFEAHNYLPMNWGGYESIEVIGNIYENPELLEV